MVDAMTDLIARTLDVPGARVYYEARGTGPVLLLIPGGNGDVGPYDRLASDVADRFTVVAYERRGFSRSPIDTPISDTDRIHADADDAVRVLDAVGADTGRVFGSSSGAIVALDLLVRHPDRVTTVIAHEPPLVEFAPDGAEFKAILDEVYAVWQRDGGEAAMRLFSTRIFGEQAAERKAPPPGVELPQPIVDMMARFQTNLGFWMEHELRQYPRYQPDLDALRPLAGKLMLAGGEESRDTLPYRPNLVLAERLGLKVVDFPGDHTGYAADPAGFAARLIEVLGR
jgi:acetyltransferase/esterase